jgi:uncharacterized repeat protein (TIGR02543 family)
MKTKKLIALVASAVITIGAITTGTIILLHPDKEPAGAVVLDGFIKSVSEIPAHLLPSAESELGYTAPSTHYIEFGEYPQTHVADADLINNLTSSAMFTGHKYTVNGSPSINTTQTWTEVLVSEYLYNGEKYVAVPTPKPYETSVMSTGTNITSSSINLWFKVEPLLWFVMNYAEVEAGTAEVLKLLAINAVISGIPFHSSATLTSDTVTYADSGIRAFLNGTGAGTPAAAATKPSITIAENKSFLQTAFNATAQSLITATTIENNTDATGFTLPNSPTPYTDSVDIDTTDKIYIPSIDEMLSAPFNSEMASDNKRKAKPTDFAMANYAYYSSTNINYTACNWWLRSALFAKLLNISDANFSASCILTVASTFMINASNANFGVRPAMQVSISGLEAVDSADSLIRKYVTYNYNLNGAPGTPPPGGVVMVGDTGMLTMPGEVSYPGYVFAGWGVNSTAIVTHAAGATNVMITDSTTIYAVWSSTPNYTIEYELGDGAWINGYSPPAIYNSTASGTVILPTADNMTAPVGYMFLRWHEGSITGSVVAGIPAGSIGNRTYYAEWGYLYDDIVAALEAEKTELLAQITDLTNERDGLQGQLNKLQEDYAELDEANGDLETRITNLEADISDLDEKIAAKDTRITELEDYITAHKNDYINGYNDGKDAYIRENGSVTWNVLLGSDFDGDLTTYTPYIPPVEYDYGEEIIPPSNIPSVQSKQYTYKFLYWSASRQANGTLPPEVTFPRTQTGRDMLLYAVYERTENEYTVTWIIPTVIDDQLDYKIGNATIITETYKYGESITSVTLPTLYGIGVNYLPNGWSSTQGGAKITDFPKCTAARTFYAKYIPQLTV